MADGTGLSMLLPTPESASKGQPLAPRVSSLRGKTIGFINNEWWSLGLTLDVFEEMLYEKHEIAGIVTKMTKPGVPLNKEEFEDLVSKADAVITGLGN